MIKFKKIRWKNFLSTGDHWTEINFLEKNTNLIIGHNGSGKSTLLDALTFVLFNKPFRKINKSQLVNTVNERECLVELEFDVNDTRGFHIFDTDTITHAPINNPYKLFYNVYYEDTNHQLFNTTEYENKIVKVIVRKKSSPKEFQKFIDKLYRAGVQDLKIVENFAIVENEDFDIDEDENTISILNRYIDEAEIEFDRGVVKGIFRDLYKQACEVE